MCEMFSCSDLRTGKRVDPGSRGQLLRCNGWFAHLSSCDTLGGDKYKTYIWCWWTNMCKMFLHWVFFKDHAKKPTKYKTWLRKWHLLVTPNSDSDNDIMMMIALISDDSDGNKDNRQWGGDAVKTASRVHSLLEKGQDNATLLPEEGNKLPRSPPGGNAQLKIKRWQLGNPQRDPRWVCAKVN